MIKQNKLPALLIVLVTFFVYSLKNKSNTTEKESISFSTTTEKVKADDSIEPLSDSGEHEHHHSASDSKYSFEEEFTYVKTLTKNLPDSKAELLEFIQKENPLKNSDRSPHSQGEKLSQKAGSVKVLALRSLIEFEKDEDTLLTDLLNISRNAKDPTIVGIAKAAYESAKNGRSLFKDFKDGVDTNMPD